MDFAALKSLKLSEFEDAADGFRSTSGMASQAKDTLENKITAAMRKALAGEAVDAAVGELQDLSKNFHYIQVECGLVSTALNACASDMQSAKRKLDAAVADAQARKFTVRSDGSVSYPAAGDKVDGATPKGGTAGGTTDETANAINRQAAGFDPNPNYAYAQECADRIAEALKEATEADQKWAPTLRKLKADDDLTVSDKDWADTQKDMAGVRKGAEHYLDGIKLPPRNGDPADNAEWWKSLTDDERADYISMHPDRVGALNGLPADVRDEANRTVLNEKNGEYRTRLESMPPEPEPKYLSVGPKPNGYTAEWREWNEKYGDERKELQSALNGMDAIQKRFDSTGEDGLPEAFLLGFDPEGKGDGKVILANGNPDTADHTAVFVPGTSTDLGGIGDNLNKSDNLWKTSSSLAPGDEVSTITWFDYDAPDNIPEATHDKYAEKAGPAFRDFLDGNQTAHQYATGTTAHTTAIGHSYGSTVIGDAAKSGTWTDGPLAADDVLVAGSPGMQADRAADLGIKPDHMWAMGAGGLDNVVREGGRGMGLGDNWTIPTDESFGGNVMQSDAGDHSAYWDMDGNGNASVSLKNQARVIVGDYKGVTLE
ncbi:alpha/beta hydrolase [Streptomyces sp. NPDC058280]|uniref:alpha/beta hydrolase n=1 Tax=Streptomyces sp. NPDC058280 TaxID=3346419 RepID=UPI0036E89FD1